MGSQPPDRELFLESRERRPQPGREAADHRREAGGSSNSASEVCKPAMVLFCASSCAFKAEISVRRRSPPQKPVPLDSLDGL